MLRFDLTINGAAITRVSVMNKGMATGPDGEEGWCVYEWNAWRVRRESPLGMTEYAAGELIHRRADGIEVLSAKVLTEYATVVAETSPSVPS